MTMHILRLARASALKAFLALGMLAALAACTFPPASARGLIVWHTWDEAEAPVIEQALADFQRLHPRVPLSVERKDYATVLDEFAAASRAGLGPDVLIGLESVYAHLLYENGLAADFRPMDIDWTRFDPAVLQSVTRDGDVHVGAPLDAYVTVLFYNPTQIDQPPKTFDDLRQMSERGVRIGVSTKFFPGYWGVTGLGGSVFNGDALSDEAEASIAAWLAWLVSFQETPGAVLSPDMRALVDAFARGYIDMLTTDSLELASLEDRMGEEHVAVATIPAYPQAQPFSNVELMVMNSASVQKEAAALLINFLSNDVQQRQFARTTSGRAPVSRAVNHLNPTLYPKVSAILQQNRAAMAPTTGQDNALNRLIVVANPIYQQVLEGLLSPQEGARQIIEVYHASEGEK